MRLASIDAIAIAIFYFIIIIIRLCCVVTFVHEALNDSQVAVLWPFNKLQKNHRIAPPRFS